MYIFVMKRGFTLMNKKRIDRLYWIFWSITVSLTGILAGYMISHSIMLGRFFSWFVSSGNEDLLHQTYTVFRNATNAHILYDIPLYLCFVSGITFIVLAFLLKRDRILSVIAGLATYWVGSVFMVIDLDEVEDAVLMGTGTPEISQYFLSINVPTHASFAVIYTACLAILLIVGLKQRKAIAAGA